MNLWRIFLVIATLLVVPTIASEVSLHVANKPTPIEPVKASSGATSLKIPTIATIEYSQMLHMTASKTHFYRLSNNPRIILVDFVTLHEQARTLNRVASLFEKKGFRNNKVIPQSELDGYFKANKMNPDTFYFGHNYRTDDLATFFNLAKDEGLELNTEEQKFLHILLHFNILKQNNNSYTAVNPPQAIVTLTQVQKTTNVTSTMAYDVDMAVRCTVLRHESSHGEFATNPDYRAATKTFWRQVLTNQERAEFRTFLSSKGYNDHNEELMANETQAYLMHSPNLRAFDPKHLKLSTPRVKELRAIFLAKTATSWISRVFYPKAETTAQRHADLTCEF